MKLLRRVRSDGGAIGRRRVLLAAALAVLVTTAGCGFILGEEPLAFEASPATVDDATLSETGYTEKSVDDRIVTRNFSAAGQTRQVEVTNHLARYERSVDLPLAGSQRAAVFVALASPEVKVATETFNPIEEMSERELLAEFETSYEGLSVGDHAADRTVMVLGSEETMETYEGSATLAGQDVPVYVHVLKTKHEGDFVVTLAVHPRALGNEGDDVAAMVEGLEHAENASD